MSNGNPKTPAPKANPPAAKPSAAEPPALVKLAPLFRRQDWLTFAVGFGVVWLAYIRTLAPELTLEDSGELCTGSFYAGIPHPPGYPFWAIYSWLWTKLLTFGNVAWRVEVGEATAAAFACGLVSLVVSRGSSMLMEGIEELKGMQGKWETAICVLSGAVAGMSLGLGGVMWSESVAINRISLFGVPWMMVVLTCMLRWIYAPHQRRYLYVAMFFFGICATIHQTLLVAAMGIEIAVIAAQPKLGRDLLAGNALIYILSMMGKATHFVTFLDNTAPMVLFLFNAVGICSIIGCGWLTIQTSSLGTEWKPVLLMGLLWFAGASFYFYEAIAGMTDPPMQWGYPRTVEGFFHALSRGQYEKANPTDLLGAGGWGRFIMQLGLLATDIAGEFNWLLIFVALLPLFFFFKMQKRERAWMIALVSIYSCIGILLVILMNPSLDRASSDLNKVFFTSSHAVVAVMIGYGLTLIAAYMATHYQKFRFWGFIGGALAFLITLYCLLDATGKHYFGPAGSVSIGELPHWIAQAFAKDQYGMPIFGNLILFAIPVIFLLALLAYRDRAPLTITLALFAAMPIYSALCHWGSCEQRNHWAGYWFGHDMFTPPFKDKDGKPLYPEMARDTVLYGGTDPGRFCPTYMIFCESFIPHNCQPEEDQKFDRRDVYLITQNALADGTYLNYLRAQYNRSKQIDPPFFSELARFVLKDKEYQTNLLARIVSPLDKFFTWRGAEIEKRWRVSTSWFTPADFTNIKSFAAQLQSSANQNALSKWLYQNVSKETQSLIDHGGEALPSALAKDLNVLLERELKTKKDGVIVDPLYETNRFASIKLSDYVRDFAAQNPQSDTRIRLNRRLIEDAYPDCIAKSPGGVYPDQEIYMATPDDSAQCFNEYMQDAQRRMQMGQLDPGEYVNVQDGRLQVSGQVAVMAINGLITKVIFDKNPTHEFYIEESFPLKWMYPHLTPFGIIMKINREPVPEITEDMVRRDHEFWSQYAGRFTGNWINYDTSVKEICDYVERVNLHHNFSGFTGDRKFARDDQAQKAFSKLRSSIASSIYNWRINNSKTPQEQQRMIKEADFAYRQAFAFCPYSPEAVFHYVQLLASLQRFGDALLIAKTAAKLDPYNNQLTDLVKNLTGAQNITATGNRVNATIQQLEEKVASNPTNFQYAFDLSAAYAQLGQTNRSAEILRQIVANPQVNDKAIFVAAQAFAQMADYPGLEAALDRLVTISPNSPEAWYDLAALKAVLGKRSDALAASGHFLELNNDRLKRDTKAKNLRIEMDKDPRFTFLRSDPEFLKLAGTN